jgi:hypothetical protein
MGTSITRARLNTPHLRMISLPSFAPVERATLTTELPAICDIRDAGYDIVAVDEVGVDTTNDLAMGTELHQCGLWCGDGNRNAAPGPFVTVRGTAAITITAGTSWVAGAITLDQTLPAGTYEVIGMEVICVNGFLARLAFPNQVWRPGVPVRQSIANQMWNWFRYGRAGKFGSFTSFAPPLLEILGTTAGAQTPEVYLDLVKVA